MSAPRIRRVALALGAIVITLAVGTVVGLAIISYGLDRQAAVASPVPSTPAQTAGPTQAASPGRPGSSTGVPSPSTGVPGSSTGVPSPSAGVPGPSTGVPSPPKTPWPSMTAGPLAIQMPVGDDCLACHTTAAGGVGTATVPAIGHPLQGWEQCTNCHSNDSLVKTAPGHTGIHADQCLICHTATTPAAEDRPHSLTSNANCLECHGSLAPLPASMRGRSEATCFLCHQGTAVVIPGYPHPVPPDGNCLACHVAGGRVGALPADHADRTNVMCRACHSPAATQPPLAPHDLKKFDGMCTFCHKQGNPQL